MIFYDGSSICCGSSIWLSSAVNELVLVSVVVELVSVAMEVVLVAMEIDRMCSPGTIAMPSVLRL